MATSKSAEYKLRAPFIAILLRTMDSIRLMGFIAMDSSRSPRGRPLAFLELD
ncbi:MAG: hypothetical protein Q9204_001163 [Flavoplaca sp. TL-2023a]